MNLKGKVALITGGGTGIGAAIAKRFVTDGAKICIVGRREEYLDQIVQSLPEGTAVKCLGDVSKPEDVERMVATVLSFGGKLDVLVNNAALDTHGTLLDVDLEEWQKTLAVNLTGPFMLMKAAIPHMIEGGGGSIINISSLAGMRCIPSGIAYCTSKAALIMLTQQAALDYGPQKIRCNVVCPGLVNTPMTASHFTQKAESLGVSVETVLTDAFANVPLRRPAAPDELSGICSFLASDDSSYMTGAALLVDGGTAIVDAFGAGVKKD